MTDFRFTPLNDAEFHRAVLMWGAGKDTLAIADELHRHESVIFHALPSIKTAVAYISAEAAE